MSLKMEGVCAMLYLVLRQELLFFLPTGSRSKSPNAIGNENRYPSTSASHLSYLSGGGKRNSGSLEVCPARAEHLDSQRGQDWDSCSDFLILVSLSHYLFSTPNLLYHAHLPCQ